MQRCTVFEQKKKKKEEERKRRTEIADETVTEHLRIREQVE